MFKTNKVTSSLVYKISNIEEDLAQCEGAEKYRITADLLTANLYRIEKGASKVTVENYYSDACETVEIALDPRLSAAANAQKYYKKYNKLKTAKTELTKRAASAEAELEYIRTVADALSRSETEEDLQYVDSMKFFGDKEKALKVRFGIAAGEAEGAGYRETIIRNAARLRQNYRKYIDGLGLGDGDIALFDFVAKGTTQMYLQRIFRQHLRGLYFLQLEPEFMADKGLEIEPFYSDEDKNTSAIFEHYYILETILTAPHPTTEEFETCGSPVYGQETRSGQDIRCFMRTQDGIVDYFETYIQLVPEEMRTVNKRLDEIFLALVDKIGICDESFLSLKVEDPFFGRMTDMRDLVGR